MLPFEGEYASYLDKSTRTELSEAMYPASSPTRTRVLRLRLVLHSVRELLKMGCYEVSLGDTLGVGSPAMVRSLLRNLKRDDHQIRTDRLAGHFHDAYGQDLANIWEAYNCGVRVFDASVAGLGGCPFAPGAKGNIATEDVVYMFHNAGVQTGINLDKLVQTGEWISRELSRINDSRAGKALALKIRRGSKIDGAMDTKEKISWSLVPEVEGLQIYRAGVTLKVVLNQPHRSNSLTKSLVSELIELFEDVRGNPSVSRIVIKGKGKYFCTGMDLGKETTAGGDAASSAITTQFNLLTRLFEVIDTCPKASVNGPAFGGGVGLAFTADIRMATRDASFTLSEVKLGLCPAVISRYIAREWGLARAREAMLSGRSVSPSELTAAGLLTEVCDGQRQLDSQVEALLLRLERSALEASGMSRELIRLAWSHSGQPEQSAGMKKIFESMMHPDAEGAYGVRKFQKRESVDWDAFVESKTKAKL
jgi:hydroxymethylglutaryl-CoA lyase